jgi:hypothetical protein
MSKKKRVELRLSEDQFTVMKLTAQAGGFRSVNAYIHAAVTKNLRDAKPDKADHEAFVTASLDRLSKEVRTVHTAQQAVFAAADSLTRLFLT